MVVLSNGSAAVGSVVSENVLDCELVCWYGLCAFGDCGCPTGRVRAGNGGGWWLGFDWVSVAGWGSLGCPFFVYIFLFDEVCHFVSGSWIRANEVFGKVCFPVCVSNGVSNTFHSECLFLCPFVKCARADKGDVSTKGPVDSGAVDANEDPQVGARPLCCFFLAVCTNGVLGDLQELLHSCDRRAAHENVVVNKRTGTAFACFIEVC